MNKTSWDAVFSVPQETLTVQPVIVGVDNEGPPQCSSWVPIQGLLKRASFKKCLSWDFPGGTVVENLSANAGDTGLIPGPGRSHMLRSNWACAPQLLKPARLEPVLRNKRRHRHEKPVHRNEEWPPLAATRESPCTATKTQHSQK